jgi:hypothetical protein
MWQNGEIIMKTWTTDCGLTVKEVLFDADLHNFEVYDGEKLLGIINPANAEDTAETVKSLGSGACPVCDKWEDGFGNTCSRKGWGTETC